MQVDATSSATSGTQSTGSAPASANVDYNSFLKLLIAQLKNQDPTDPSDPAQWISQLASFSSVEQQLQTNNKLDALMTSMALQQADGLIGRTVTWEEGDISGKVASVKIITGGAVAVLEDGTQLLVSDGLTISE